MPTVLVYRRLKRNACRETDNYNRSGNRALFLSAHSYTFVSSILFFPLSLLLSLSLLFPSSLLLSHSFYFILLLFTVPTVMNQPSVLLAHSSTIHLLFTSRISPPFYYAALYFIHLWISSITSCYSLHPSCPRLFLLYLQSYAFATLYRFLAYNWPSNSSPRKK